MRDYGLEIKIRNLLEYDISVARKVREAIKVLTDIMIKAANYAIRGAGGASAKQEEVKSSMMMSDAGPDAF